MIGELPRRKRVERAKGARHGWRDVVRHARKQLCKLLEELNSLQRGVLEGSSTPSQENEEVLGRASVSLG